MTNNHPPFHDKLGPLPADSFDEDFAPDKPAIKADHLTPEQRRVLEQVLAANPTLTEEEALGELLAHGL